MNAYSCGGEKISRHFILNDIFFPNCCISPADPQPQTAPQYVGPPSRWKADDDVAVSAGFWNCRVVFVFLYSRELLHTLEAKCPPGREQVNVAKYPYKQNTKGEHTRKYQHFSFSILQLFHSITILTGIFNGHHMTQYVDSIGNSRLYFIYLFLFVLHLKTQTTHGAVGYRKSRATTEVTKWINLQQSIISNTSQKCPLN